MSGSFPTFRLVTLSMLAAAAQVFATADGPDFYRVKDTRADDYLNMRAGPGVKNEITGQIPHEVGCLENLGQCQAGWCRVRYLKTEGWVSVKFITEDQRPACFKDQHLDGADLENKNQAVAKITKAKRYPFDGWLIHYLDFLDGKVPASKLIDELKARAGKSGRIEGLSIFEGVSAYCGGQPEGSACIGTLTMSWLVPRLDRLDSEVIELLLIYDAAVATDGAEAEGLWWEVGKLFRSKDFAGRLLPLQKKHADFLKKFPPEAFKAKGKM